MRYWTGKTAIITGGSRGFGRVLVEELARAGARVMVAARDPDSLESVVGPLQAHGAEVRGCVCDATQDDDVQRLLSTTLEQFKRLDLLVNNVGRSSRKPILDTTPEDFAELFSLNFLSAVRCTRAAVPELLKTRGHVVQIASLAARSVTPFLGAYPAGKAPLAVYSQQLRYELGPAGLHVLLVCPGPIQRADAGTRYSAATTDLPAAASQPGGGVRLRGIPPQLLAHQILRACEQRKVELVIPAKARLVFALLPLWPTAADWIIRKMTK